MDTCHEIEPLLARRADDDLTPEVRSRVEGHLDHCADCRRSAAVQHGIHDLLAARAPGLRTRAPEALRARVAAQMSGRRPAVRWTPFRVPMAATAVITLLVMGLYGMTGASTTVLAAQLALDHLKCVKIVKDGEPAGLDAHRVGDEWTRTYDWTLQVPELPAGSASRLISARRCLYGHGHLAHLLYNVNGRVVSLFVMPRTEHPATDTPAALAVFGQQARVWASGDQTFALVADADASGLDDLEREFRQAE